MKKIYSLLLAFFLFSLSAWSQIVTTEPEILQESSKNVVLTYHADQGNKGLAGLTASTPIYAHIGVITNNSKTTADWKYVVTDWPNGSNNNEANTAKNKLNYVGPNTWSLNIGDMRSYFGITDSNEHIEKIALVFRTADGSKEGKTQAGGDILVDVQEEGFQLQFTSNLGTTVVSQPTTVTFTAVTSQNANITITVNSQTIASNANTSKLTGTYTISTNGGYTVQATATANGTTLTKTISMAYPGNSTAGTYPGGVPKMGAVKNSDGTVTFCLAAPQKSSVVIVPAWDNYEVLEKNIMKYQDYNGQRYFFITVSGLKDNVYYPYYYIVDAKYKVGDPYAKLVLDYTSDKWMDQSVWPDMPQYPLDKFDDTMLAVYRGDMDTDFKFSEFQIPDRRNLVIYEMLIRDFTGTEGEANGEGTFAEAIKKLPYLQLLGVNAVELLPVMEFGGNNSWGYNTNFYFAPDKAYGSPRNLKHFVETCHNMGIAVILDIALNHSDGLHPWWQMYYDSASSTNSSPFYNAVAPHAWSVLNDWKQEHTLVKQQWKDVIKHWMTVYNVDGFRFDLVKGLGTNYAGDYNGGNHNTSRIAVMKELHAAIKAVKPDGIHINEAFVATSEENEYANDGQLSWANVNNASCQFAMAQGSGSNLQRFEATKDNGHLKFATVAYAESHDEERMGFKLNQDYTPATVKNSTEIQMKRLGQVAVQMLLMPGSKMIWQFGELGADETTKQDNGDNNTDPKKVIWSYLDDPDRAYLHDLYRTLNYFRKDNPELFINYTDFVLTGFADNISSNRIIRLTDGKKEVMAFINPNLSGANRSITAQATKLGTNNKVLIAASKGFNNANLTGNANGSGGSVAVAQVPPNGFAVFATNDVVGVDDILADGDADLSKVTVVGGLGEILVYGDYENIAVFDLSGRQQKTTGLLPGVYVVKVDSETFKVAVK